MGRARSEIDSNLNKDQCGLESRINQLRYLKKRLLFVKIRNRLTTTSTFLLFTLGYLFIATPLWNLSIKIGELFAIISAIAAFFVYVRLLFSWTWLIETLEKFSTEEHDLSGEREYAESCLRMHKIFDSLTRKR
jgi:hypothetical protein